MYPHRKGSGGTLPSNHKTNSLAGGKSKGSGFFDYRKTVRYGQCQKCGSDYMRFSVNGFCQDCQQKVEFIVREHPHVAQQARSQAGGEAR